MKRLIPLLAIALCASACVFYGPDDDQVADDFHDFRGLGCKEVGDAQVDPIVNPGEPSAHMHTFVGAIPASDDTTWADLRELPNTCKDASGNRSLYWFPTAYDDQGQRVDIDSVTIYYRPRRMEGTIVPWGQDVGDPDFRMITDQANISQNAQGQTSIDYNFGNCWNGSLDSPDHRSHVTRSVNGECPPGHLATPAVRIEIDYADTVDHLSSGDLSTAHADYMFGWDQESFARGVNGCMNIGRSYAQNAFPCGHSLFMDPDLTYEL